MRNSDMTIQLGQLHLKVTNLENRYDALAEEKSFLLEVLNDVRTQFPDAREYILARLSRGREAHRTGADAIRAAQEAHRALYGHD